MTSSIKWLLSALALAIASQAMAQLAPTGGHYAGRATDTGYGGTFVSATGTFAASIPLEFPAARGGLPVPLEVLHSAHGVGAAGLGWHVPLSYVSRERSFAHRRPSSLPGVLPVPRERAYLSVSGQNVELVQQGNIWIARSGTLELVVRESGSSWLAYDGQGRTYTFVRPPNFGSTGPWLLKSISAAGGARVELTYQITDWPLDGGVGTAIDLIRIAYNTHPGTGCAKHEITLAYGSGSVKPISMSVLADKILVRKNLLTHIDVNSRATCASPFERLRRYDFQYSPDSDTQLPRLSGVRMFGRQGTAEEDAALPIATYKYGSATQNGTLHYEHTQTITLPNGVANNQVSGTATDSINAPISGQGYAMWQSLTDVSGDGRPDLVFKRNNKLWVALNQPAPDRKTTLGATPQAVAQLADTTFANGAFSTHTTKQKRFAYGPANRNTTNVWRQAIDVNGDGRIDIIDAVEQPDRWVVYLNTPGSGPSGVKWVRRSFWVKNLRATLVSRGHIIEGTHLPLSRRATGTDVKTWECWRWNASQHKWQWYSAGFSNHRCEGVEQEITERGPERTFVEWELTDLNGDGYPDFVFNSSPVDFQVKPPPSTPTPVAGAVWPADFGIGGPLWHPFAPRSTNEVRAAFNVRGVRFDVDHDPFARSVNLFVASPAEGVGEWRCTGTNPDSVACSGSDQSQYIGFADVNGDGLVDRVVNNRAYLGAYHGTALAFSKVYITLPGPLSTQRNTHGEQCVIGGGAKPTSDQTQGLRDLTGDGIPDYFDKGQVWIGTGTGFRQPVDILVPGGNFRFSHQTESCNGDTSLTDGGLFDIDGDGRPEVIGLGGNTLIVSQLTGGQATGIPDAGRLTEVDNGFGAKTSITYVSAKHFTSNRVPFPEIVVGSVATKGTLYLGGTLAGTRYAYGNGEMIFDSALDSFTFRGYGRRVEIALFDSPLPAGTASADQRLMGAAAITDTWPLTPFNVTLTKQERWLRTQRAGRVRDVFRLRGIGDPDPWSLLGVDANDPRVIGVDHYEWKEKLYELSQNAGQNAIECTEMMMPFDFALSFGNNLGSNGLNMCRAHGFVFSSSEESWYGASAPPSNSNVQALTRTLAVDDFGRTTMTEHAGDRFRSDDNVCVESTFATPLPGLPRVLTALASRRVTDCNRRITYSAESWTYDGLAAGTVSNGRATSHTLERRATDNGALLRKVRTFDAAYDAAGKLMSLRTQRNAASRTVTFAYDPFGLVPTHSKLQATGLLSTESSVTYDPVSLDALSTTVANGTTRGAEFDGFGRLLRSTITSPGGSVGVVSITEYVGFSGGDSEGRRIIVKDFMDPVAPQNVASARGKTGTIFMDELGRDLRTEIALGSDYGNEVMVVGSRSYDGLGRVAFVADPYPKSQNPATAYGSSYHYKNTGEFDCIIRGRGPQALNKITDIASERFPTCFDRTFVDHVETLDIHDAASQQTGSPQAGVVKRVVSSAIGRVIERSAWKGGVRLDYAALSHDRLGRLTSMTRFLDPDTPANPVRWWWRLDSAGQILELAAPEAATRVYTYSDWGEPVETRWTDAGIDHRLVRTYDARSRLTGAVERNNGIDDPETANEYAYDTAINVSPLLTPSFVLGRLAGARSPRGQVVFSYDPFGRVNARWFITAQSGPFVEKSEFHGDGSLASLEFNLPDQGHAKEIVKYEYDSANRLRTMTHSDPLGTRELYRVELIDPFGRVRKAFHGGNTVYHADYEEEGRRLLKEAVVESSSQSRRTIFLQYDAVGRELSRREIRNGAGDGRKTNVSYDALGRLANAVQSEGPTTLSSWAFSYDALGNLIRSEDVLGNADATLSYNTSDRDRICRIGYGNTGLGGTVCNVAHDVLGNIVNQPTRTGSRQLTYFLAGGVRTIMEQGAQARFAYDAFDQVEVLDVQSATDQDRRRDRRFGRLIEQRDVTSGGATTSVIVRHIPGPGSILASRRGASNDWVFEFGELRGNRFFTDQNGTFLQDVDYQPFGEATSSGAPPGSAQYTSYQWNGGDALSAFGLSQLGARLYDPVIARFLSRDAVVVPRTATTTNPYAFAMNDPLNAADPSGLQCIGKECEPMQPLLLPLGLLGGLFDGGSDAPVQKAPPVSAGPQTREGKIVKRIMEENEGFTNLEGIDWDNLAAMKLPYDDLVERLASTQATWYPRHEGFNPVFNLVGSMGAGFGDFATFGGTAVLRNQVFGGFHSVDESSGGYLVGEGLSFLVPWGRVADIVFNGIREIRAARTVARGCVGGACGGSGVCFVAGTPVATPAGPVPIEQLRLGDRVESGNPQCANEHLPEDSISITLEIPNPAQPTDIIRVELARPRSWLAENGLSGGTAWIDLPEVGVAGWARVVNIGPAPREASGEGCLVLMAVEHIASEVLRLRFDTGGHVEVTPTHPLFVEGRGWVSAGELTPGMLLRSDYGSVLLTSIEASEPNQRVFNIEVGLEHTYRVSPDSIWTHNSCSRPRGGAPGSPANRGYVDGSRRFHNYGGTGFPTVQDLQRYSVDELLLLREELVESVRMRIAGNVQFGFDAAHAERQAGEQALIRAIDKLLK